MALLLAFAAGILSILSPCVLPILPIVLTAAVTKHRYGPLALAAGLVVSFVAIGLFISLVGFAIGLDGRFFRTIAGIVFIALGGVLVMPSAQAYFAAGVGSVSAWALPYTERFDNAGSFGQFCIGLLLGAIWTPCVGPTLGAASLLAAQGKDLGHVLLVMTMFGLGAALPLLAIGALSRGMLLRFRDGILGAGKMGKAMIGIVLLVFGILILSGLDKRVESYLVEVSPSWLTELTTRY